MLGTDVALVSGFRERLGRGETPTTFANGRTVSGSRILATHLWRFRNGIARAGAARDDGEHGGTW